MDMTPATSGYRWIADQIARSIQMGDYTNGDKLPPQRQLAARFGVTVGTVTRAYAELERKGLVVARMGDGTYVNCTEPGFALDVSVNMAFNVAAPVPEALAALKQVLASISTDDRACRGMLDYPSEFGISRHRAAMAQWLQGLGGSGLSNRIMLTNGAQHAISCVVRTMTRPGDVLLTESLSYHGLRPLEQELRLQVVGVASDAEGLLPEAVERAARTHGAKVLYCIPSLQMPTASTMPLGRRRELAAVARRNKLLVIEDCVHALGQATPLPALSTLLPEQSFLVGSFSKVTLPALRVGFIEADPKWLGKIALALRADSLTVASLLPEVIVQWMENGCLARLIQAQQAVIAERQLAARRQIDTFSRQHGVAMDVGCDREFPFLWLKLPAGLQANALAGRLQAKGVLVRPSDYFRMGRTPAPQALRISLGAPITMAEMERGLQLIMETVIE